MRTRLRESVYDGHVMAMPSYPIPVLKVPLIVRLHSWRIEARQSGLRANNWFINLRIGGRIETDTYPSLLCSTTARITESHPTYPYLAHHARTLMHSPCKSSWV